MFYNLLLLVVLACYGRCDDGPTAKIPQGKLLGTYKISYKGRKYSAFEGIPYVKPPLGELRFQEPQQPEKWDGVLSVNTSYVCLTYIPLPMLKGIHGDEDCLYMYVYVPREIIDENENLDVVVHIHGGAFMFGAPKQLAREDYLMDKDLIYVSFNYRLGILGFLSTEDEVVPGNNGLKDQVAALKWVNENIKYFGGNPDSITITGLSAGAASVHYHYLSSMSRVFHAMRLISELEKRWDEVMPYALDIKSSVEESKQVEVTKILRHKYIKDKPITNGNIYDFVKLFTDRFYLCDAIKAVRLHSKAVKSPVYYYWFNYTLEQSFINPFMPKGVSHGDDGKLTRSTFLSPTKLNAKDEKMMELLTQLVVDYAANKELALNGVKWSPVNPSSKEIDYLKINSPKDISMVKAEELCDVVFWNSLPIMENDKLFS